MTSQRPYRRAISQAEALAELRKRAGTQFDPQIAAAAVEWCNTNPNELILPAEPAEAEALAWGGQRGVA